MTNPKVIVLGDANVDMLINLPDRTSEDADLKNTIPELHGGGSSANTAVALARLGVPTGMMGSIGEDGYGRWIIDDLRKEGVNTEGMTLIKDGFTSMVMALIEPSGERMVIVWPPEGGADLQLSNEMINTQLIKSAQWVHVSGICLRKSPASEAILHGMQIAHNAGIPVSLDLNLRIEYWGLDDVKRKTIEKAISLADVVFGNATEEILPITEAANIDEAAKIICDNTKIVVARNGAKDAFVTTPAETFTLPAFPIDVVDTLGAGDAFNGGYIAAKVNGLDEKTAIIWGHAVSALKIGKAGARGLPSMERLNSFLQK